jgi:glycine betaine/proline transport system permease protein
MAPRRLLGSALLVILIVLAGRLAEEHLVWAVTYPSSWVLPVRGWISAFFEWLVYELKFFSGSAFEFSPRDVTRGFVSLLGYPLWFTQSLFFSGFNERIPALPWVTVVGLAAILGHWAGGWRTALVGGLSFLYLALFGVWEASMQTFSLVIMTVPLVRSACCSASGWPATARSKPL